MVAYETNAAELKRTIHELHTNAMEAEKEKRSAEASGCWSRMADCFRLLAKMETNMMECARLHQKALRCAARAGNSPNAKSQAEAAPNDADDLDKLVAGLIYPRSEVSWDDIGGMEQAKHDLKYAIGLLLARRPEELKHLEIPTRVLLYGPPGTGKTLLAAATARTLRASFFNVKVSDLLSKFFGESTKIISALYTKARDVADSGLAVVFIDEIESLMGNRDSMDSGAERRMMSTLLSELDGLAEKKVPSSVVTITATNRPWDLDPAILSRMDLRVFVDVPDAAARAAIFRIHLGDRGYKLDSKLTYERLAAASGGSTGRDIQRVCKKVILHVLASANAEIPKLVDDDRIRDYSLKCRPLRLEDFAELIKNQSRAQRFPDSDRSKYLEWSESFGSGS